MLLNKFNKILAFGCVLLLAQQTQGQTIPKEELIYLTSEWKGERFADGRPKVSDDLVERAKKSVLKKPGRYS